MRVFIVEDEVPAREELERMLRKHFPDIVVAGRAGSVRESAEWLRRETADLIFMDIQLSDGCCFDIFNIVDVRTPIIFTTAYDQYALRAFKANSVDYLLKPVDEDELVAAVRKLDYSYGRIRELIEAFPTAANRYKTRIAVRSGDTYGFIPLDDVSFFMADDGLTFAVTASGKRHLVNYTIAALEPQLDPRRFFRVTRGCIISIDAIGKVSAYFNSRLKITVKGHDGMSLVLSRARVPDFLDWMDDKTHH